jgi:chemotaxis protein methyltransferase CheR
VTLHFDPASPERFREAIVASFGLSFDDAKLGFLNEVLRRRAESRGLPVEAYLAEFEAGAPAEEAGRLAEELTVGETYFFRNSVQFDAFREVVLPERMKARGPSGRLSFLSAGCASGEEPFTLAMVTREAVPTPPWQVSIRAVDLNPAALRKAAGGRYTSWALRETPPEIHRQWFEPAGRDMLVKPEIRSAVQFQIGNLAEDDGTIWRPATYDAIFCRNVIMYFTPAVQQAVIARIARSLVPGGYLFLGHAETLRGLSQEFHLAHTHDTFYYRRKRDGDDAPAWQYVVPAAPVSAPVLASEPSAINADWYAEIGRASRRIELLAQPAPDKAEQDAAPLPQWNLGVALDLLQKERFAEALDLIGKMPPEAGQDPDVLLLQAMLLVQDGKLAPAAEVCRLLLAQDELNAGANYVLALCFEGTGDRAAAIHHFRVAGYLDPQFAMPQLHLGLLSRRAGNAEEASHTLERALDLLKREDASRLLLFGGGFTRDGLIKLCEAELRACEAKR